MNLDRATPVRLDSIGTLRNGVNFNQTQEGLGIPVLKVKDFGSRFFAPDDGLDELDPERITIAEDLFLRAGDVIVIRSNGNGDLVGRCLFVPHVKRPTTFSGFCIRFRPEPSQVDPRYASYLLRSPYCREQLVASSSGTGIQNINQDSIGSIQVDLPTLDQQRAIAAVLGCLDNKIALNSDMNSELEELAGAIFKSWFVDFEPVAAKCEGRKPVGVPADALDLFPSQFEDSVLGPIPRGWTVSTIGSEVTVVGGSTPSTGEARFWNGDISWITPRDLSRLRDPVVLDSERHITAEGLKQIGSGLLPKRTVLLSSRAPIGYLAISEVPLAVNQGFIAMKCDKALSPNFVLNWTRENLDEVLSRAGGTTFAEISKSSFRPIPVVVASPPVLRCFDDIARPLHEQLVSNVKESQSLASLRDALLPALLSGEITVKAAEKTVAEVV